MHFSQGTRDQVRKGFHLWYLKCAVLSRPEWWRRLRGRKRAIQTGLSLAGRKSNGMSKRRKRCQDHRLTAWTHSKRITEAQLDWNLTNSKEQRKTYYLIQLSSVSQRWFSNRQIDSPREITPIYPATGIHCLQLQNLWDMYIHKSPPTHKSPERGPEKPLICQVLIVSPMGTMTRFYGE